MSRPLRMRLDDGAEVGLCRSGPCQAVNGGLGIIEPAGQLGQGRQRPRQGALDVLSPEFGVHGIEQCQAIGQVQP